MYVLLNRRACFLIAVVVLTICVVCWGDERVEESQGRQDGGACLSRTSAVHMGSESERTIKRTGPSPVTFNHSIHCTCSGYLLAFNAHQVQI